MERRKPKAVFMAFGTKGDVYPLAAIASAFACDQKQYEVILVTHSAHKSLSSHLTKKHVEYCPVSSPPVLSADQNNYIEGKEELSFSLQKEKITRDHRQECYSLVERIFGNGLSLDSDLIVINFFALEGWSLAESFCVRCIVAAPYVVPYSAPATFESQFQRELPLLYRYLTKAPSGKDPVTGIPTWHDRPHAPLVMYGFSKEVVECPAYWPSKVRVCGSWFLPPEWQFTCKKCRVTVSDSSGSQYAGDDLCPSHLELQNFLKTTPIFIGLSSIGSMGFLKYPHAFLCVLQAVVNTTSYRFILFTAAYEPLESLVCKIAAEASFDKKNWNEDCVPLFDGRILCFSGSLPYGWLFKKCAVAIHHGGSGTTAAALQAGIPQVVCPFMLDQFYWAERMHWLGVSPEPLSRNHLFPDNNDQKGVQEAAHVLSTAIHDALSSTVKAHAVDIAERISREDGVSEAIKCIKEELGINPHSRGN